MARRRKSRKETANADSWLNTYADMVTLVLCFFVLLYSMSTMDAQKWEFIVKSLNPDAALQAPIDSLGEEDDLPNFEDPGDITFDEIEELYQMLKAYVEEEGLEDSVELLKGEGLVFLTFRNNIFFDGNSSVLKADGKEILDVLAGGMEGLDDQIGEVRILGHTTQQDPNRVNSIVEDRYLASDRAVEVLLYMQMKDILDAKKFVSSGYGQHYPISSFDTEENRAKNRRVEIIIIQNGDKINMALESVYGELGLGMDNQSGVTGTGTFEAGTVP